MGLTVGGLEAEGKEIVREANSPCVKYLGCKCLMELCESSADKLVGADGLADGEDHVPKQPWVAVRRFLKSIVNHPLVSVGLDVFNRWKVVDDDKNATKQRRRRSRCRSR